MNENLSMPWSQLSYINKGAQSYSVWVKRLNLKWEMFNEANYWSEAPSTNMDQVWFQHGQVITCPTKSMMKLLIHFQTLQSLEFGSG